MNETGTLLAERHRSVSARDIIVGAVASRDWQPQHHDHAHALAMNLPDIIMNTPTQTGWFHAYAMDWAGAGARIGRWRLKMRFPVCPDTRVTMAGRVSAMQAGPQGSRWLQLSLAMRNEAGQELSSMVVAICLPASPDGSCWTFSGADWNPPPLTGDTD